MPYAPGVQDISGQLRAQGIAQAGQAWSQAIGNIGNAVTDAMQTYKQNQFLTNQALGDFTAATQADQSLLRFLESGGQQQDPNAPKIPVSPNLLKAYANVKSGDKVSVNDAALLGALGRTWMKTKAEAIQQQHIALQNQLLTGQVAQLKAAQDEYKAAQERMAQRDLEARMSVPATSDEAETEAGPDETEKPSQQPSAGAVAAAKFAGPAAGATAVPAGIPAFIGQRRKAGMSETAPWSPQNPIGIIDPQRIEDEMTTATGRPNKTNVQAEIDRRTKIKEGVLQSSELKTTSNEIPNPDDGGRTLLTVDARTNTVLSSRLNKDHPEVAGEIAAQTAEGGELGKTAVTFNNQIVTDARRAGASQMRVNRMRDLLNYTDGLTGSGEDNLLNAKGYAARLGFADAEKLQKQQEFDALVKREQLDIVNDTLQKGTTSDRERELYAQTVVSLGKTKEANLRLLELTEASNLKAIAAEKERQRLSRAGLSQRKIKTEMENWINSDENFVENFIPKVERRTWNDATQTTRPSQAPAKPSSAGVKPPSGWSVSP